MRSYWRPFIIRRSTNIIYEQTNRDNSINFTASYIKQFSHLPSVTYIRPYHGSSPLNYHFSGAYKYAHVEITNNDEFQKEVVSDSDKQPVIIDFYADWCPPCKILAPMLEAAVARTNGKVKLVKADVDKAQQVAEEMMVSSIPAVFAFHQQEVQSRFVGTLPQPKLNEFVDNLLTLKKK